MGGRILQKKKNRSSIPKLRMKPKSKKKILANPIIAANWNQKETLSQNYRRLGLTARLNHATGGTEKTIKILGLNDGQSTRADAPKGSTADALNVVSRKPEADEGAVEEVEVERDPETGRILRVVGDDAEAKRKQNPLNDSLNEVMDEEENEEDEWNGFAMVGESVTQSDNPVIQQLEQVARNGVRTAPRKQSQREEQWIERLVEKYGDDYSAMVWDRKLNPMQQSEGDLKRRVKKWRKNQTEV